MAFNFLLQSMDTFNWSHHLFHTMCFIAYTLCEGPCLFFCGAFFYFILFFCLLSFSPEPKGDKTWQWCALRLWGSAQLLFIKQLRPLFEGYHTHLYPDTIHTLQQTHGNLWEGWGGSKEGPKKCKTMHFLSLKLHQSHKHTFTHTVRQSICMPVTPRWIKLPVFVHFQRSFF